MDFLLKPEDVNLIDVVEDSLDITIRAEIKGCVTCGTAALVITQSYQNGPEGGADSSTTPLNDLPKLRRALSLRQAASAREDARLGQLPHLSRDFQ